MLMTHYREPIDFSVRRLEEAENLLTKLYRKFEPLWPVTPTTPDRRVIDALFDDLQTSAAINILQAATADARAGEMIVGFTPLGYRFAQNAGAVLGAAQIMGLLCSEPRDFLQGFSSVGAEDTEQNTRNEEIAKTITARLAFIRERNWAEADRIRDELLAQGIQLKDGKDPATGERVTTWEVRR
jgi:cysteinyl-tRNA synthetase